MKELFAQYAAYNMWANRMITTAISNMGEEKCKQYVSSSFPSLHATLIHLFNAENIWYARVMQITNQAIPVSDIEHSTSDVIGRLMKQSELWVNFVQQSSADQLNSNVEYKNSVNESFLQPLNEILLHLFNHGSYHRGQLITMMRMLGETHMPKTDYILFARRQEGKQPLYPLPPF